MTTQSFFLRLAPRRMLVLLGLASFGPSSIVAQPAGADRLAEGIRDNSFLVEEAYNQEPGVVQHILNLIRAVDRLHGSDDIEWAAVFGQEWPFFSQAHQLSYSVPYRFLESGGESGNGIGDVFLNYRFQALMETDKTPAFSPRLSVILPTGDTDEGFVDNTAGYQLNLPVSKIVSDRVTLHGNAGATVLPNVNSHDLMSYNLGLSAIYAVSRNLNLMVECVGNWDEEVNDKRGRERNFAAIVSPGLRYAFNHANDAQTVVGLAAPIGVTATAPDYGIFLYVSFEHFFVRRSPGNPGK